MKTFLALVLVIGFSACATSGPKKVTQWQHMSGPVSDQQFYMDRGACVMEAEKATAGYPWQMKAQANIQIFMPCMASKGYQQVEIEEPLAAK